MAFARVQRRQHVNASMKRSIVNVIGERYVTRSKSVQLINPLTTKKISYMCQLRHAFLIRCVSSVRTIEK